MPVLKRRGGSIAQRKKYHSKRKRSHRISDISVRHSDHSYSSPDSSSAQHPSDHTQQPSDLTQPPSDHTQPTSYHAQPTSDHTQPTSDHTQPPSENTELNLDHTRPPSDHIKPPSENTELNLDHPRPPSDHIKPPSENTELNLDHTRPPSDHIQLLSDHTQPPSVHTQMPSDNTQQPSDHNYCSSQVISDVSYIKQEAVIVENVHLDFFISQNLTVTSEESIEDESIDPLIQLRDELIFLVCSPYTMIYNHLQHAIEIIEFYKHEEQTSSVKLNVVIGSDLHVKIFVHKTLISHSHDFWSGLSTQRCSAADICKVLEKLKSYGVCLGNPDVEFQDLAPIGCGISHATSQEIPAFREGDFGAVQGNLKYNSTIRSSKCDFLVQGVRCVNCAGYRRLLRERKYRKEEQKKRDISMRSTYKHADMTRDMLCKKLSLQKDSMKSLQTEINRLKRELRKARNWTTFITKKGETDG